MSIGIGPNVRRLIARKMSLDAIPNGGGFAAGLEFLASKENIKQVASAAAAWVRVACQVVRGAAEPNPWKESTDEEIAGYLLDKIAEREKQLGLRNQSNE